MKRYFPAAAVFFLLLAFWQAICLAFNIPEYLLPAPTKIFMRVIEISDSLALHATYTGMEAAAGLLLGTICGILLASVFVCSASLERGLYPFVIALKTTPVVAVAPLLVVWFGNGLLPKIFVSALICFFPVVVNTTRGLKNIDPELHDLFDSFSASKTQIFMRLRVPSCMPYFFSALRTSSTLAVIGAVVGEFSGADKGLGYFMLVSSHRLETIDLFVGIFLSSILGIIFFISIIAFEWLAVPWQRSIRSKSLLKWRS